MEVYIFVIWQDKWNTYREKAQEKGLSQLNGYDLLYRYYQNENLIICFVPQGFDNRPDEISRQLSSSLNINNLSFKVIYSSNHRPGDDWEKFTYKKVTSEKLAKIVQKCNELLENIDSLKDFPNNLNPDPLMIIFTLASPPEVYKEWDKAIKNSKATFYDDDLTPLSAPQNKKDEENKIRIAEFKVDDFTVLLVKENGYSVADGGQGINDLLTEILDKWKQKLQIQKKEDIYVAVHALSDYAKNKDVVDFINAFKDKVAYICNFHHYTTGEYKEFTDALIEFLDLISKDDTTKALEKCEEIKKLIEKLSTKTIKKYLHLSHRIVHLFLPLDIDLMGICEVLKEDFKPPEGKNKEEWAKEYYDEAFKDASPKYKFEELCNQVKAEVENTELDNDKKGKILQMFNYDDMDWNLPSGFKIDEFQQLAEKNPFHQWFCGVMKELEKMREESFELFGERSEIFKKLVDKLS